MKGLFKNLALTGFITLLFITNLNAQENLNKKLEKIEGSIYKITITADGKEYLFEGDEA